MKILYVCRSDLQSRDANAVHVLHMTRALCELGHEVSVVAAEEPEAHVGNASSLNWQCGGRHIKRLPPSARVPLLAWRYSKVAPRADVILSRHLPSAVILGRGKRPLIVELHALQKSRLGRWLEAAALRSSNLVRVIAISEPLRRDLLSRYPFLSADTVRTLHDAAVLPDRRTPPALKHRRAVLQIGYVGNLYPGKGAEMTLRLAAELPQFDFHLVGGSQEECMRVFGRPLPANIQAHGYLPHADLAGIYASLDVGLVPISPKVADRDGNDIGRWTSPLKLFEYLAAGLAVIASDVPSLRGLLQPDHEALVVPPDDVAAWTEALIRLDSDERLRRSLSRQGRELVERRHTWAVRAHEALSGIVERSE
ncbi:glycosyltransferase family 4 protein [Algiphilus sp.]|uniref:glycosyltransferase family 4 protein n=1 Tax=Algiphilus sp. TaxID=1872431 RepID=UPI003B5234BD